MFVFHRRYLHVADVYVGLVRCLPVNCSGALLFEGGLPRCVYVCCVGVIARLLSFFLKSSET